MPPSLRLAIAASHQAVADALLRRLSAASEWPVDGLCVDDVAALGAALQPPGTRVALIDGGSAGGEALAAVAALRAADRRQPVVVLVGRCDAQVEIALARAGASATVARTAPTAFLLRILRICAVGSTAMSVQALLEAAPPRVRPSLAADPLPPGRPIEPLTDREAVILARIRRGESNRTIGDALGIDENRVKIHLRTIFRKTGARNRTEAALRACGQSGAPPPAPAAPADRPFAA